MTLGPLLGTCSLIKQRICSQVCGTSFLDSLCHLPSSHNRHYRFVTHGLASLISTSDVGLKYQICADNFCFYLDVLQTPQNLYIQNQANFFQNLIFFYYLPNDPVNRITFLQLSKLELRC